MQRFKNILCVVVPDAENEAALERAAALSENNQARLMVVEVTDKIPPDLKLVDRTLFSEDFQAKSVAEHQKGLQELVAPWNRDIEIQTKVLVGIPFLEIIREVLRNGRDLVIKAAESGGLLDRVFGSDDMHLLRKCPCPVWLVKSKSPKAYQRILAAVDVNDYYPPEELNTRHLLNLQILEMASSLALSEFAQLHVVHVWDAVGEMVINSVFYNTSEGEVAAYVEQVRRRNAANLDALMRGVTSNIGRDVSDYLRPKTHLIKGSPRKEVPVFAKEIKADLVIMGTVARTGIPGFIMGNTAETILSQLDCSILTIKPPGFATPVALED